MAQKSIILASALILTSTSSLAFAACDSSVPVFTQDNLPPNNSVMQMCVGGSLGVVGCDIQVVRESNLGKSRIQKIMMERASRNAKGAVIEFVKSGEWESTDAGREAVRLSSDGRSDSETYESESTRIVRVRSKLISGMFTAHQNINDQTVTVCMASSLESNSIANRLNQADESGEIQPSHAAAGKEKVKTKSSNDGGLNSTWTAPIPNN